MTVLPRIAPRFTNDWCEVYEADVLAVAAYEEVMRWH